MREDIQLRRYQPQDVDAVYEAVIESQAELSVWMPWCHADYSRSDSTGWVESRPGAWDRNEEWSYLIVDSSGRLLGGCGIHRVDFANGVGELGYWVRSSATRRGVATEATRQACEWAFREQGLHRIEILASVENVPSQQVAEKAGFAREAILRERLVLHGRRHDAVLYSRLNRSR